MYDHLLLLLDPTLNCVLSGIGIRMGLMMGPVNSAFYIVKYVICYYDYIWIFMQF